jgi:hypothetical protein
MSMIVLDSDAGERLALVTVTPSGDLLIEARGAALRALIEQEVSNLIQHGPLLHRSGYEETLPDGTHRFVTTARVCQPGEPAYLQALARRIGWNKLKIRGSPVYAWVDDGQQSPPRV